MKITKVLGIDVNNVETKTIAEIDQLVASSTLAPLTTYEITGVDPTLYGGTTIYLQAVSNNTLNERGIGKFYNPKYGDYPIWRVDLPGEPPFMPGDAVIWGGKVWINNGNDAGGPGGPGEVIDIFTLGGEEVGTGNDIWSVAPYTGPTSIYYYNIAYDEVVYSYADDLIIYRNEENTNIVSTSAEDIIIWPYSPVKVFQWGNPYRYDSGVNDFKGIGSQYIVSSYNENINFNGRAQYNITMKNYSRQSTLTTDDTTKSQWNLSFNNSQQIDLTLDYTQSRIIFDNYFIDRTSFPMVADESILQFQGSGTVNIGHSSNPSDLNVYGNASVGKIGDTRELNVYGEISVNTWYGATAVNISLSNIAPSYQIGVLVEMPTQTQLNPPGVAAPDAFVARLNGQNPDSLSGNPAGFVAEVEGGDNISFMADLRTSADTSTGYLSRSHDSHNGNHFRAQKYIGITGSNVFTVANNGDVTANKFMIPGGANTSFLMADGSTSSGGTITANNGLTMSTSTNAQLGGTLLQNTLIDGGTAAGRSLTFTNGDLIISRGIGTGGVRGNIILDNDRMLFWGNTSGPFISGSSTSMSYIQPTLTNIHEFNANMKFRNYGTGTKTGTVAYLLAVTSTGDVIETQPYKVYTALLTRDGATAPSATVLENTLGGTVSYSYDGVGIYKATTSGLFTENKTFTVIQQDPTGSFGISLGASRTTNTEILIVQSSSSSTSDDNWSHPVSFEIRVYN